MITKVYAPNQRLRITVVVSECIWDEQQDYNQRETWPNRRGEVCRSLSVWSKHPKSINSITIPKHAHSRSSCYIYQNLNGSSWISNVSKPWQLKQTQENCTAEFNSGYQKTVTSNDWKTLNRTPATPQVDSAPLTFTEHWAPLNYCLQQGCCIVRCFLCSPCVQCVFPTIHVQMPTWWSQHGMVKIHGLHGCCHGDHTVSIFAVCLQQAALCQSLSCQTDNTLLIFPTLQHKSVTRAALNPPTTRCKSEKSLFKTGICSLLLTFQVTFWCLCKNLFFGCFQDCSYSKVELIIHPV